MVQNVDFKEIRVTFPYNSSFIKILKQLMDKSGILKKNFAFEIKKPRKDQELPVLLSKEEISRLLFEVTNINITTRTAERVSDIKPVCGDI